jgi:RNA polymerase sigma factor for flagellar operon FliA
MTVDIHLSSSVDELWQRFRTSRDPLAREALIVHYSPLVKFVAGRLGTGLPSSVDAADLVSYGVFGLLNAIDRFEPERGTKFEAYAVPRIRGAIVDELRDLDWIPRSVRAKARDLERATTELEHSLHRVPTEDELAAFLDLDLETLRAHLQQVNLVGVVALDDLLGAEDRPDSVTLGDILADRGGVDPAGSFESIETREALAGAIGMLPERERMVVVLYYYEGMTLSQIGHILGVTESRVCQIHTKAVLSLRSRFADSDRQAL